MRVVPSIASDQFYLEAGEREHSMLVSVKGGTCGFWVQDVLVCRRAGPSRCEGYRRVNQTGRVQMGMLICAMGLGAEVSHRLWSSLPFYSDPDNGVFRAVILTHL